MQVRHNTTLLERAVEHVVQRASIPTLQAHADALERMSKAQAIKRIATGAAAAIVAIGVGLGVKLALNQTSADKTLASSASGNSESSIPIDHKASPSPTMREELQPAKPGPIPPVAQSNLQPPTVDFTKFTHQRVTLGGRQWLVSAGHQFDHEEAKSWQRAWCYTHADVAGVSVRLQLAERATPDQRPTAPIATIETLQHAGVSVAEAFALASKCSWLDRPFAIDELIPSSVASNPFRPEQLKANLQGRILFVSGNITTSFVQTISRYDFDTLEITSSGGLLKQALLAGRLLRAQGKHVRVNDSCLSACVLVLAGGATREAGASARIGVHRFKGPQATEYDIELAQEMSSELIGYLSQMGVSVDLFHAMAAVPSEDMRYLSRSDMERWNLVNGSTNQRVVSSGQSTQKPGSETPGTSDQVRANTPSEAPRPESVSSRTTAYSRSGWNLTYASDLLAIVPDTDDKYNEQRQTYDTAWRSIQHGDDVAIYVQVSANRRCGDAQRYVTEQLLPRRVNVEVQHGRSGDPLRSAYTVEGKGVGRGSNPDSRSFFDFVTVRRDDPSTIIHVGGRFPTEHTVLYRAEILKMLNSMQLPQADAFSKLCTS